MWKPDPSEIRSFEQDRIDTVRVERNRRLADSDWTQVPDAPTDKARWAIYRQMLRDMDFTNPVWPIAPTDDLTPEQTLEMERQLDRFARTLLFDGKNKQERT